MKKAFTLIELVFVIVVIGILAAIIIPRTNSQNNADTAIKLLQHVRYAQHLAMVDDKFSTTNPNWFKERWKIIFNMPTSSYSIMSGATYAKDTANNGKELKDILIKSQLTFSSTCGTSYMISFDNMGRPLLGDLNNYTSSYMNTSTLKYLTAPCILTLSSTGEQTEIITIMQDVKRTAKLGSQ